MSRVGDVPARSAGILLPLFSIRAARDSGIGDIPMLAPLCRWLARAGHRWLQILPIMEMSLGERSPYAALSAFAIDSIYLGLADVEDVVAAGAAIDVATEPGDIDYDRVRAVKRSALERAFDHFMRREWATGSTRARVFGAFREEERHWLDDYSLFRACQEHDGPVWTAWEPRLRDREPTALAERGTRLARERLYHEYVQWLAAGQWEAARREVAAVGVRLKGDLPFVVSTNSADVWSRQREFRLDASLGAPPDDFDPGGQEWGLPVYDWDAMGSAGFAWLRARAARAAALFDAFRIDHVVGFYRQYVIEREGPRRFVPEDEAAQLALGERLLTTAGESAAPAELIGEDLGVVPPFVRESLTRLAIPGYRVLRWEKDDGVFRDPAAYPSRSVATPGTHDTSALATWWETELDDGGRRALAAVPVFRSLAEARAEFTPAVHAALLDGLYAAASELVVLPLPDAYGGRERINVPATVGAPNWGYRMPWTVDELLGSAGDDLAERLRVLATHHGRA